MKLQYTLEKEDYENKTMFECANSEQFKKQLTGVQWRVPVIMGLLSLYYLLYQEILIIAIIFFILAVLWYTFSPRFFINKAKKINIKYSKEKYHELFGKEFILEIKDDSISIENGLEKIEFGFETIKKATRTDEAIFIQNSSNEFYIIPINKITEEECKDLLNVLSEKIQDGIHIQLGWKFDNKYLK
ncbi:YcxB family protein [Aureivirga sp. CE67]|uniref:YcxB family protein n=1 Tax=Aureivirga sp. CE67 TaxID=1788983 RepID=UPI0018CA883A|nr:YcxB family protein [Aureivirga sp. CE67]